MRASCANINRLSGLPCEQRHQGLAAMPTELAESDFQEMLNSPLCGLRDVKKQRRRFAPRYT